MSELFSYDFSCCYCGQTVSSTRGHDCPGPMPDKKVTQLQMTEDQRLLCEMAATIFSNKLSWPEMTIDTNIVGAAQISVRGANQIMKQVRESGCEAGREGEK